MSNPLKKLASQTAVYGLGSVLPRVITFLYSFVLTYIFEQPSQLSANTEFYAYISFLNILFTYGLETAFFHFSNKIEDKSYIFTLNVCATQELHRRIVSQEERIKELETKLEKLISYIYQ